MYRIAASIVLYNHSSTDLFELINELTDSLCGKLFIIDNSPVSDFDLSDMNTKKIEYIRNPENPGYGAAHNIGIRLAMDQLYDYYFVINPDIQLDKEVIEGMVNYMSNHSDVGMMMPRILNGDGSDQFLPKLLPSPISIVRRKLRFPKRVHKRFLNTYELRYLKNIEPVNVPVISGCFTLFRLETLKTVGLYDDRFFMYFEDWDISRRVHEIEKTLFFPKFSVHHGYHSGANHNLRLFGIYLYSALHYFNKWGWFFDSKRREFNRNVLLNYKPEDN